MANAAVAVACGSASDPTTPDPGVTAMAGTTVVHVSAALGGTVSDPAGKTTLTIPPGALEADTDITLSVEAASAGAATDVSSFGPDGP